MAPQNEYGQPIGHALPDFSGCAPLPRTAITGKHCDVVPLSMDHAPDLHRAFAADQTGTLWTYMPIGPFADESAYAAWVTQAAASRDPMFFAIIDKTDAASVGVASYLRIKPEVGVAEVGYLTFAPRMQRTRIATEAMYLMMRRVFELGYRRYEWKCDALNAPSRRAAERFGFAYEGTFRHATIYKGRNRDT
ncbi:MAG: GNAT family protein, partial [Pseudomonadota bacterium]